MTQDFTNAQSTQGQGGGVISLVKDWVMSDL